MLSLIRGGRKDMINKVQSFIFDIIDIRPDYSSRPVSPAS